MIQAISFTALGLCVGTFGTLVGAGGGFILMPIFLFLYPNRSAEELTAISLSVVALNALSGTIAYAKKGRVDYRSGILFALASIPGAVCGALTTVYISRRIFDPIFAFLLLVAGFYLFVRPMGRKNSGDRHQVNPNPSRMIRERDGTEHQISYNMPLGLGMSTAVGYISSLLGIGGGIIHVPALVHLLNFPVHIATATSHFILAIMTLAGTLVHLSQGNLQDSASQVLYIGAGVIVGAQLGAKLSSQIHAVWILRALAIALVLVGLRLLLFR